MAIDLLQHIQEDQLDANVFNAACHSITVGPVKATFCLSLNPPSASVELYIAGHQVGSCTLSQAHPACKIGGSVGPFKAELDLTLDIGGKKLDYKLTVCAPFVGCHSKSGTIPL